MRPRPQLLYSFVLLLSLIMAPPRKPLSLPIDIGEQLSFTTLESSRGVFFPWSAPGTYLLWEKDDIAEIDAWIFSETRERLESFDFSNEAVIAVFHGWRSTYSYEVVVEHYGITEDEGGTARIVLIAQFWERRPGEPGQTAEASPYHFIKIRKDTRLSSETNIEMHSYTQYYP